MAAHPGLARRNGLSLTIFYGGKTVATLTPTGSSGDCDRYYLDKVLQLYDRGKAALADVAEVVCFAGEFDRIVDVMPDGTLWWTAGISASPDGKLVALNAYSTASDDRDQGLTIVSWPDRAEVARFGPDCKILGWLSTSRLKARCVYDPTPRPKGAEFNAVLDNDDVGFNAYVRLDKDGSWQMQATADELQRDANEINSATMWAPNIVNNQESSDPTLRFVAETGASTPADASPAAE